jgi:hypothetical protein
VNRSDASALLNRSARQWPGKVAVNRDVLDAWTNALADMDPADGHAAYEAHVRDCPHPATPADLWAAHRRHATTAPPPPPAHAAPTLALAAPHEAPDQARAALAEMRATLGPSRYHHPGHGTRRTGRKLDPAKALAAQAAWDRQHNPPAPLEPGEP